MAPVSRLKKVCVCVSDWQDAISVGVLDCAQEENFDVCKDYSIKFYPTFKVRQHVPAAGVYTAAG